MSLLPAVPAGRPNVILAEPARDSVLAAVSLARRLPGGSTLLFADRDHLDEALSRPGHRGRSGPYRLIVVGADLSLQKRSQVLEAIGKDPAHSRAWIDANHWTAEDASAVAELTRGHHWNSPVTHHPFPAIEAAQEDLALTPDPFGEKLLTLAERRLPREEETSWGGPWRDSLDALEGKPLELPDSVRPLLHGMPEGLGVLDRGAGEALRTEVDRLVAESNLIQIAAGKEKAVLLILPRPGRVSPRALAEAALARSGAALALVLYDRGEQALLLGRRHGADPPTDVRRSAERLLQLPFCRRDRLAPGLARLLLADPPKDRLEQLVAALA